MDFTNIEVRALWWKQPFASMMLHDKVETRTWDTTYRGWVLICCSMEGYTFKQLRKTTGLKQMARIREALDGRGSFHLNGLAIAVGRLTHCQPMHPADEDMCFVKYDEDLYCHVYEDVMAIVPFKPFEKGQVGWKSLDDEVKRQIVLLRNLNQFEYAEMVGGT